MYESEAWRFRIGYPGGTSLAPDETSGAPRLKMGTGEYAVTVIRFMDSPIVLTPEGLDAVWVEHTDQDIVRIFTETWHADLAENVYSDVGTVEYVGVWRDSPRGAVSWRMDSTGTLHGEKEWLTTIFVQTWHTTYAITAVYDTLDVRSDVEGIIQSFEVVSPPTPPAFVTCARSVNVRSGPGTNHAIISQLAPYEPVEIVGRNEASSWWQVCCFDGEKGWVAASVTIQ